MRLPCAALWIMLGAVPASAQLHLRLSTTTSTDQTGLLKTLLPPFEQRFRMQVDVIAVGSCYGAH